MVWVTEQLEDPKKCPSCGGECTVTWDGESMTKTFCNECTWGSVTIC